MRQFRLLFALIGLMLIGASPALAQNFPKFTGFVVDDANVLPPNVEADLTAKLDLLQKDTSRQVVVATIADLQGYPLEEYGYKLGRAWGVGLKNADNGVVIVIAPNNPAGQRGPRIEVGRGLEPILTDALTSGIVNTDMMPRLRAGGDIAGALTAGTDAVVAQLRASPEEAQGKVDAATADFNRNQARARRGGGADIPFGVIFFLMIVAFIFLSSLRRKSGGGRRYRGGGDGGLLPVILWSIADSALRGGGGGGGSGWSSGGGSDGGGWGGGGFGGGGGGSFGGGGASGSW